MRIVCLIVLGVVVGWAASGVDWSREAIGQEAFNTTDAEVPKGRPFIATDPMSNEKPASENISRPPQWPRRVLETQMEVDANGKSQPVTVSRLVNADGSIVPESTPPALVGRFQASAYGSPNGHGCFIFDTMTGKTWHVANGQQSHVVTEALIQPSLNPGVPVATPAFNQPPAGMSVAPTPSYYDEPPQSPQKSNVVPTPAEPEPHDAN